MTCSARKGDSQISAANSVALRTEIGERLRTSLDQRLVAMPPDLIVLVKRLCDEPARSRRGPNPCKDFSHASFPPDTIGIMTMAMESALLTLNHPLSSARVQAIAKTILRQSKEGERDHRAPALMALLELVLSPRN